MLKSLKYIGYIKCLCWSIKVKLRIAVFTLGGAELDTVIYRIWMPYSALFSWYSLLLKRTHVPKPSREYQENRAL